MLRQVDRMGTDTKSAPPWLYDMFLMWRLSLCCGFASAESLRPVLNFTAMFVFVTRHTLIWQGTKFSVFFSVSGYRYLGDGGTDRSEI